MNEAAFLSDIIEHPDDDAPRLVFADWLEDHGDAERGEFIRLQCRLAGSSLPSRERAALEKRQINLLNRHADIWAAPLHDLVDEYAFERGFIERVAVDEAKEAFFANLDGVFAAAPVRHLRLEALLPRTFDPLLKRPDLLCRLDGLDLDQAEPRQVLRLLKSPGLKLCILLAEHADDGTAWDGVLRQMSKLPSLGSLVELGLAPGTRSEAPTPRALDALLRSAHLVKLERLHLPFCRLEADMAHYLAHDPHFANLTHLDLGCAELPEQGWEELVAGPNLRRLTWFGLYFGQVLVDDHGTRLADYPDLWSRLQATFAQSLDLETSDTFPRWKGRSQTDS